MAGINRTGTADSELLPGTEENDYLYGVGGDDQLLGLGGQDWLSGGDGNDWLEGGGGRDFLMGGAGDDTYKVDLVSGDYEQIYDGDTGWDVVLIAASIRPEEVRLLRQGYDLVLHNSDLTGDVRILNYFWEGRDTVEWFRFEARAELYAFGRAEVEAALANGGKLQYSEELTNWGVVEGTWQPETLTAGTWGQVLRGREGADTLRADTGNAVYDVTHVGGWGDDVLVGSYARDFYRFDRGDGHDRIVDDVRKLGSGVASYFEANPTAAAYQDRIIFGEGIRESDVVRSRSGTDLVLRIGGSYDSITIDGWFDGTIHRKVEEIVFTTGILGGLTWTIADTEAGLVDPIVASGGGTLAGGSGNDTLTATGYGTTLQGLTGNDHLEAANDGGVFEVTFMGGKGDDVLVGSYARDHYRYEQGDGNDVIVDDTRRLGQGPADYFAANPGAATYQDHLYLGQGITSYDVTRSRNGDDLVLSITNWVTGGGHGSITVRGWFDGTPFNKIETLHFYDGTVWNQEALEAGLATGVIQSGSGTLRGSDAGDTLIATGYGTVLQGRGGDDLLRAEVSGSIFDLTFEGGTGNDRMTGSYARDVYRYKLGDGHDVITDDVQAMGPDVAAYFAANPDAASYQDELVFTDVYMSDVTRVRDGQDLVLQFAGGSVRIAQWFDGTPFHKIEKFVFPFAGADSSWAEEGLADPMSLSGVGTVRGGGGNDTLLATGYGATLQGMGGNDNLGVEVNGAIFDVTLAGGSGDDVMRGSYARDFYRVGPDGGNDLIIDDVRVMGQGVADYFAANPTQDTYQDHLYLATWVDDVWVSRTATDLVLHYGMNHSVTVAGWFDGTPFNKIEVIEFDDGTTWDIAQVELIANAGWSA